MELPLGQHLVIEGDRMGQDNIQLHVLVVTAHNASDQLSQLH